MAVSCCVSGRQALPAAGRINSASVSQIQSILELCENPNPLRLYGFYEFTDSNLQLISAFSEKIDIHIYMPYFQVSGKAHPGYSFTERVIEELTYRTWGKVEFLSLSRESTPVSRFFLETFPEGKIGELESEPHPKHDDLEPWADESILEEPLERRRVDEREDRTEGDVERTAHFSAYALRRLRKWYKGPNRGDGHCGLDGLIVPDLRR